MQGRVLEIAARVIQRVDREHPADAVLRHTLGQSRGLSAEQSRAVARTVFSYYRWLGGTDHLRSVGERLQESLRLAEQFARNASAYSDAELRWRALPSWIEEYVASTGAWIRSLQREPTLWLRARPGRGQELAAKLGDCRVRGAPFPDETLEYQGARDLFRTVEFHAGEFELQDLNSQAVGLFCDPKPGETWWDACAGEGGKTLHLGDLMRNKGLIWASDRAPARLRTLKRRAARARLFNYRTSLWNGDSMPPTKTKFDGVLLDAPCSGIGTWHRNPHARWTTRPEDVVELAAIQQRLLARVVSSLKPGGRLVYAVCTLSKPETLGVASAVSAAFPELEPLAVANPFDAGGEPAAQHWLWPQTHGGNGMFVALWRRTGSRA